MARAEPRRLSPPEQAETDRTAEAVLAMLKRVIRRGQPFDRAEHDAWVASLAGRWCRASGEKKLIRVRLAQGRRRREQLETGANNLDAWIWFQR